MSTNSRVLAGAVGLISALGCSGTEDCTISASGCGDNRLFITANPSSLAMTVGDTARVGLAITQSAPAKTPVVQWAAGSAAVRLESSGPGVQVLVRAVTPGSTSVTFTVNVGAQTVIGSIPVTVNAP